MYSNLSIHIISTFPLLFGNQIVHANTQHGEIIAFVPEILTLDLHTAIGWADELVQLSSSIFPSIDFDKPLTLVLALTLVIIYSTLSMLLILIFVLTDRGRRERLTRLKNKYKQQYQVLLIDYLENPGQQSVNLSRIKEITNTGFTRRILINEMIDLSINLQKSESENLRDLFFLLNLNTESLKKLDSSLWHIRVKGFRECSFMDIPESLPKIQKYLHSRHDIVRSEAQLALVRLNKHDPYAFLDHLKRPFSLWEQNIVHEAIITHKLEIPEFERWIFSDNKSVVKFAVKMIYLFKQTHSWPKLLNILDHEDEKVRATVITTLGHLKEPRTQTFLKNAYEEETDENRVLIIQALAGFKSRLNLVFFKHLLEAESENVWLQIEAAKGILQLGDAGKTALDRLMDYEEYRNYQIIIKHVRDKRL